MSKTPQTEAQRIADGLLAETSKFCTPSIQRGLLNGAIQELRRLDALCDERGANEARMLMRCAEMQATIDQLRAQLAKAVAEEREACAKVCESEPERIRGDGIRAADQLACAAAIRARSNT